MTDKTTQAAGCLSRLTAELGTLEISDKLLENEKWYWVRLESFGNVVEAPAMYLDDSKCFYSYRFGGIPAEELTVLRSA